MTRASSERQFLASDALQVPPFVVASVDAAVIGTGFGCRTIVPVLQQIPGVTVRVLCGGQDRAKTRRWAERFSIDLWDQSFDKAIETPGLDLVFIASPHEHHAEMVERAMDRGLHVVCEKPLALSSEEIGRLVDKGRCASKLCLINHQLRFLPTFRAIRDLLRRGDIGRPYHARVEFFTPRLIEPDVTWRWWFEPEKGGGMLVAMASHLLDLMQFWFGGAVKDVVAHLDPVLESIPTHDGTVRPLTAESFVHARLRFESGVLGDLVCSGVSQRETSMRISILATEGELVFDTPDEVTVYRRSGAGGICDLLSPDSEVRQYGHSVFHQAFQHFAQLLAQSIQHGSTGSFAREATSFEDYQYQFTVLEAMRESHLRRAVVGL